LIRRYELNSSDGPAFKSHRRVLGRRDGDGDDKREKQHRRTHAPQ
jgi:hypothetical protein